LALDPVSHNIVVVDSGNARIEIFNSAGTFLSQFGSFGTGDGQFDHPLGVAVDPTSRNIVVVDTDNHRVQIFDSAGNYLSKFGSNGSGNGQFSVPIGVAIDPINHNIAVVDRNNNRVQIFDSTGNYLSQFGSLGTGNGQFTNPIWAAIDPSSRNIVVVEGGAGQPRAQIFALQGAVLPPTIAKAFGAGTIQVNTSTSLTFTIQNPNTSTLTGVGFNDPLPAGLLIATPNGLSGSCGGGVITVIAGTGSISLASATLAASASCTFSVDVMPTLVATYNNVTGNVTSIEGGSGATASASITAISAPPPPTASTTPIPTLQEWALSVLAVTLLAAGAVALRSRRNHW
jgi:DNA-binding beta-propeller fold protein YncE